MLECEATRSACGRIDLAELHALADELRRLMAVDVADRGRVHRAGPRASTAGCTT